VEPQTDDASRYRTPEGFFEALAGAYGSALYSTVLDKFAGKYDAGGIRSLIDRADVLRMAFGKIRAQ
jgi:hypothetical protein